MLDIGAAIPAIRRAGVSKGSFVTNLIQDRLLAVIGGLGTLAVATLAYLAIGQIYSDAKAVDLIGQLARSATSFGSAIATSSATTLALMLTAIGMANRADATFDARFYVNVYRIAVISTITLAGSVVLLLVLTLPVGEFHVGPHWFIWLYRLLFALVAVLSSLLVAMVLLVFAAVRAVIVKVSPSSE